MIDYNKKTVIKGQKELRYGYTTGTCAAAASKAAALILLSGKTCQDIKLTLPNGDEIMLEPLILRMNAHEVECGIIKNAGDDPDITHGIMVCATLKKIGEKKIEIDGGKGVGRVTKAGLDQPIGNAAINSVPRKMIHEAVESIAKSYDYQGGFSVTISVPDGEEKAKKTMNPFLGIVGGLSILGTTGIVEPMSEQALLDTIAVDIRVHHLKNSELLIMAPGNYGLDFMRDNYEIDANDIVKISNYIGASMDLAVNEGVKSLLLVGHIGKLIKIAGGIMNTHSHEADARMEILAANAAVLGVDLVTLQKIMSAVTTEAALDILKESPCFEQVMARIVQKIHMYLSRRVGNQIEIAVAIFSSVHGLLAETENVQALLDQYRG